MNIEYLAGLFDGEGTIGFYRHGRQYLITVSIEMTHQAAVRLFLPFGGGIYSRLKLPQTREQHCWRIRGRKAVRPFVETFLPLMFVKKPEFELALEIMNYQDEVLKEAWAQNCHGPGLVDRMSTEKLSEYSQMLKDLKRI